MRRPTWSFVANPGFQSWAAWFPLTRPFARRGANSLFDLAAGFVYAQILAACVRLRLLETLRDGPLTATDVALRLDLPAPGAQRLCRAAAALGLLSEDGVTYRLALNGAALLGNPGVSEMVAHHGLLYADLFDPVGLLRANAPPSQLAEFWPYAGSDNPRALTPDKVAAYSGLMAASNRLVAEQLLRAYPVRRHRRLMDVGGGDGAFLLRAAAAAPALHLALFDLPSVVELARARLSEAGALPRATLVGGDFLTDELPKGADLVTLIRVAHDHGDGPVLDLLRNIRRALPAGGTLLLAEPMAGLPGAARAADAYFGFYLLAMGSGRARRVAELIDLLRTAGFRDARSRRTAMPMLSGLIVAHA